MKTLLILLITLLPALSFGWDDTKYDTVSVYYEDSTLKELYMRTNHYGNEKGFVKHGQYMSWYKNGKNKISAEYAYVNTMTYSFISWYENGMKAEESQFINAKKHGLSVEWYQNHTEKSILYYKQGNLHGLCKWFKDSPKEFMSDNLDSSCFYMDGKLLLCIGKNRTRLRIDYPFENKELDLWVDRIDGFDVGKMNEGKKHGKWTTYNERGEMIKQDLFDNGVLVTVED